MTFFQKSLIEYVLKTYKIKYTSIFLKKMERFYIDKHLLSDLSIILSFYGLKCTPFQATEKKHFFLNNNCLNYILQIDSDNVFVTKQTDKAIFYYCNNRHFHASIEEFEQKWNGLGLYIDRSEYLQEPFYFKHKSDMLLKNCLISLIIICVAAIFYFTTITHNLSWNISLLANIGGIAICGLLINKNLDSTNPITHKICTFFSIQDGCSSALNSPAATIIGSLNLSKIGLGFFVANTLILLAPAPLFNTLLSFNIPAILFSIWSVYYQKFIIKQWCILCLLSMSMIWIFFLTNINAYLNRSFCIDLFFQLLNGMFYILVILIIHEINQNNT